MPKVQSTEPKLSFIQLLLFAAATSVSAKPRDEFFIVKPEDTTFNNSRATFDLAKGEVNCFLDMPSMDKLVPGTVQYYTVGAFASPGRGQFNMREGIAELRVQLADERFGTEANLVFVNNNGKHVSAYANDLHVECWQTPQ
jgi:hypothetical protein